MPHKDKIKAVIAGTGSYLPKKILTNADMEKIVDTTDEWIVTRTGIKARHIASEHEPTSMMAAKAAQKALDHAGMKAEEIQMIIVATITPDMPFPNTACFVQQHIGAKNAFCFDIEAACTGFIYSLEVARQFIETGRIKNALVIGAEKLSTITDWTDRTTCVLFGDGAGAVVVKGVNGTKSGIMSTCMGSDGTLAELLHVPAGGSRNPATHETIDQKLHYTKMEGREVFKHAVRCMIDAGMNAIKSANITLNDIALIIPHQANLRIIQAIGERLEVGSDRVYTNLERVGNISAASIPVALDEALNAHRLKDGDKLLFIAFGGGFTWGAMVLEWGR